jgi:protein-tyrosine phosphatase
MRRMVDEAGLAEEVEIESAGTSGWHVGEPPDRRAAAAAAARGYLLESRGREVRLSDFAEFDLIVAMDHANLRALRAMAPDREARLKPRLLLGDADVPDPYSGGPAGFEHVLDLIEAGSRELLAALR